MGPPKRVDLNLQCMQWPAGAPTIASKTGEFVAGNRLKRLASAATIPSGSYSSFDEMKIDSAWRVDAHQAEKKQRLPEVSVPESPAQGVTSPGEKSVIAEAPAEIVPESPGKCGLGSRDADGVDDIPVGYSPGSTQKVKAKPAVIPENALNKFDKYYYRSLAGIQFLQTIR